MEPNEITPPKFVHVHECSSCGRFGVPEQFSARDNVTGLYECPFCYSSQALNIKVVSQLEIESQL